MRCPICEAVTVVQQIRIQCLRCVTPLLLPVNTVCVLGVLHPPTHPPTQTLALCPRCGLVMRIPPTLPRGPGQPVTPAPPPEQKCMVYVENPPTKANGKTVQSVSVGTKVSDTPEPSQ